MLSFGGFLNSSFWSSYRSPSSTSIEEILNSKDCTVEKLLEDDDCLQEFKNLNEKLVGYFDHEKIKRLIDLITVMPPEDAGQTRGHKLPFISSEIFNCEINQILDKFFDAKEVDPTSDTEEEHEEAKHEQSQQEDDHEKEETTEIAPTGEEKHEEENAHSHSPKKEDAPEENDKEEEAKEEVKKEESSESEQQQTTATTESETATTAPIETLVEEKKEEETKKVEEHHEPEQEQEKAKETEVVEPTKEQPENNQAEEENKAEKAAVEHTTKSESDEKTTTEQEQEQTQSTLLEPEDEESTIAKKELVSRFILLDRLFKFLRTDDKPLNPVLSGYFAKLVTLLINRKQKQLIPFIYAPESDIIDRLLYHVYQKSISELLNKLLSIQDNDFDSQVAQKMQKKQQQVVQNLLQKLSSEASEEDNLNGCSIMQDMLDIKEFYHIICKKNNVQVLVDYVLREDGTVSSRTASAQILTSLAQLYHDKFKGSSNKKNNSNNNEEDDEITLQSDEEETEIAAESPLIDVFKHSIKSLVKLLQTAAPPVQIENCYDQTTYVPLGQLRLKIVELIMFILKLHKETLYETLEETDALFLISQLFAAYPWNNFLQLKVIAIYEEIFENNETAAHRKVLLQNSNLCETLIKLAEAPNYKHESNRNFRYGYMAAVIKLANFVVKNATNPDVAEYTGGLEGWTNFVDDELKKSNDTNNKSLGGQQPRHSMDDDDNDNHYEVNMEKIMQRFSNYNTLSMSSSNQDDEEDDDENKKTGGLEGEVDNEHEKADGAEEELFKDLEQQHEVEAHFEKNEDLLTEFNQNVFWKVPIEENADLLEELLKEMSN